MNYYQDVMDWIQEYQPELIDDEKKRHALYEKLFYEEVNEFEQAIENRDIIGAYDALCDKIRTAIPRDDKYPYILIDQLKYSNIFKIDCFNECREEVKRSNRTKSKARREDGKIIKGDNYEYPNLLPIIKKYHDLRAYSDYN